MLAAFARSCEIKVAARGSVAGEVSEKQKKSNDQRAPVTRYYLIKDPQSLDMKYYLVTGGLLSVAKLYKLYEFFVTHPVYMYALNYSTV